jgi:hypothetical protein
VIVPMDATQLGETLSHLLQETDPHRPLDSLETVVVLTYLGDRGIALPNAAAQGHPKTIEGWVTWVADHSVGF